MKATPSLWQELRAPRFPKLEASGEYDVVIIGGGITGLTAAYLLKEAGRTVCVIERDRIASGDTGHTTAHLTWVTDSRISDLVKHLGVAQATRVLEAGAKAIDTIEEISAEKGIDCRFRRVPGFLMESLCEKEKPGALQQDSEATQSTGFSADFMNSVPFFHRPAVRFPNQAKFHPLAYLAGLSAAIPGRGSAVFENTEVTQIESDPLAVRCGRHRVTCDYLVIATHVPMMGNTGLLKATMFQTKLSLYTSYVLGAKAPRGLIPEACFWDTGTPYYYLRVEPGAKADCLIWGGEDHKTGQQTNTQEPFRKLERTLRQFVPKIVVNRRWSGQVIETADGLPYIGETAENQFVATGFAGNGMTFGTIAGLMARDAVLGRRNPWQELFAPQRKATRHGAWKLVRQNLDYPLYLVKDHLSPHEHTTRTVKRGEGKILRLNGKAVACYRDDEGRLSKVSAVCTHMGCHVRWNSAEQSWDCPCHGSRFKISGEVLAGPAEEPLEPFSAGGEPEHKPVKPTPSTTRSRSTP